MISTSASYSRRAPLSLILLWLLQLSKFALFLISLLFVIFILDPSMLALPFWDTYMPATRTSTWDLYSALLSVIELCSTNIHIVPSELHILPSDQYSFDLAIAVSLPLGKYQEPASDCTVLCFVFLLDACKSLVRHSRVCSCVPPKSV